MENLKIRVATEAESKEAQELFFELGYKWFSGGKNIQHLEQSCSSGFGYLAAWSTGCFTNVIQCGCGDEDAKEITIQELRDMVNPMKEYLEKQADGSYKLVMRGIVGKDDDIEVPGGADSYNEYTKGESNNTFFLKMIGDTYYFANEESGWEWERYAGELRGHEFKLWQRHTQPEELPFLDSLPEFKHDFGASSLNDQYAEIEQVRQHSIEATLAERQAQYGCFEDVARTTGKIMEALAEVRVGGLDELPYPHRMALYMIASKMARIVNGDFNHKDSWHDIGGYSKLIEDLL